MCGAEEALNLFMPDEFPASGTAASNDLVFNVSEVVQHERATSKARCRCGRTVAVKETVLACNAEVLGWVVVEKWRWSRCEACGAQREFSTQPRRPRRTR